MNDLKVAVSYSDALFFDRNTHLSANPAKVDPNFLLRYLEEKRAKFAEGIIKELTIVLGESS